MSRSQKTCSSSHYTLRHVTWRLLLWTALLLCVPAQARVVPKTFPFTPGEHLTFMVSTMGMKVGIADLHMGKITKHKGKDVVPIRGKGETRGVYRKIFAVNDQFETLLDIRDFVPVRFDKILKENDLDMKSKGEFDFRRLVEKGVKRGKSFTRKIYTPPFTQDIVTAVYFARVQSPHIGNKFTFPMIHGTRVWVVTLKVIKKTTIETPLGPKEALFVSGEGVYKPRKLTAAMRKKRSKILAKLKGKGKKETAKALKKADIKWIERKRPMRIWVTTDEKHIPLRMETEFEKGKIIAELTSMSIDPL